MHTMTLSLAIHDCGIRQDLWLKMHSGEDFTKAHCGEELARLLRLYRSATLEVIEDMMRHPDLEQVADGYTRKKVRVPFVASTTF